MNTRKGTNAFSLNYHLVIVTKSRMPLFTGYSGVYIEEVIRDKCNKNSYFIKKIKVMSDHIHILLSLKPTDLLSKVIQEIKGYSSYMYNRFNKDKKDDFVWQRGYCINTVRCQK